MDVLLERLDEKTEGEIIIATEDFSLAEPEFIIGRAEDCNLRLPNRFVSRHHCELIINDRDRVVSVRDLGSQNGTFVNDGAVVDDCELKNGDRLVVGCIPFEVHIGE
jgi:pSer/pThr/pTyr-binding forkhead associated (FHA) protein